MILDALKSAGSDGICISDLERIDWTVVLTARNRVAELRREGFDIEGARCHRHAHRGTVFRYTLSVAADLSGDASYHSGRAEKADASTDVFTTKDSLGATGRREGLKCRPSPHPEQLVLV